MLCSMEYVSPVGVLTVVSRDGSLAGLWIAGQKYFKASLPPEEPLAADEKDPVLLQTKDWLDRYFAGKKPVPAELPLSPAGSPFRQAVWHLLCEIPYGEVTTYGTLARKLAAETGKSGLAFQAIGGAVGHNPISIIIPCHRVIGSDGRLTGYAGGLAVKQRLLQWEGAL